MVRKLRTLSGCLTCRARRKKCDESKPQCTACNRLRLRCNWASSNQVTDIVHDINGPSSKTTSSFELNIAINSSTSILPEELSASKISADQNSILPHRMAADTPRSYLSHFLVAAARLELQSELSKQCPKLLCLTFSPSATRCCSESLERELGQYTFGCAALSTFSASVEALRFRDIRFYELKYRAEALAKLRSIISKGRILHSDQNRWACIVSMTLICLSDVSVA